MTLLHPSVLEAAERGMQSHYKLKPAVGALLRRAKCNDQGCEEMPTSTWEKTGIPVIIGVALFIIVFIVLFVIVRKRRQVTKKREDAEQAKIDLDDVEDRAAFRANNKS